MERCLSCLALRNARGRWHGMVALLPVALLLLEGSLLGRRCCCHCCCCCLSSCCLVGLWIKAGHQAERYISRVAQGSRVAQESRVQFDGHTHKLDYGGCSRQLVYALMNMTDIALPWQQARTHWMSCIGPGAYVLVQSCPGAYVLCMCPSRGHMQCSCRGST